MAEQINLAARLSIDNEGVFAEMEKKGALSLGEITDFGEKFLEDVMEAAASKMLLEYLKGEFPSIEVSIDVGPYNDMLFQIDNPVNGILSDPVLPFLEPEPLIHRIYGCVDEDCYEFMKPHIIMLLLEAIESSISE